jgi:hypothetical protein
MELNNPRLNGITACVQVMLTCAVPIVPHEDLEVTGSLSL